MSRTAICAALGLALAVFVSHKVVQAAPIVASDAAAHTLTILLPTGEPHTFQPSPGFFARAVPTPGDYFVVYQDGYQSHSPKDIFEGGYKAAEDGSCKTYGQMIHDGLEDLQPAHPDKYARTMRTIAGIAMQAARAEWGKDMTFGEAIEALKSGQRVARAGWNGKGMWLELVLSIHDVPRGGTKHPVYRLTAGDDGPTALPWIGMKTADNKFVPWLASQTDMLADDWTIVG